MTQHITCTPRTLPPESTAAADQAAIDVNPQNRAPRELAVDATRYWGVGGVKLTVGFLGTTPSDLRARILSHMNAWNKTANVEFTETEDADGAQVRINRETSNRAEWNGYWSFLGTDVLQFEGPFGQTMNLEGFTMSTPDEEFFRVVRHEAGHTLGFPHEHMRRELVEKIDRAKAIVYYHNLTGWTEEQIVQQVLTPLEDASLIGTEIADPKSIMAYQVPGDITIDGQPIIGGMDIDPCDYDFCAKIYPKP